jgi:hypothetical protein
MKRSIRRMSQGIGCVISSRSTLSFAQRDRAKSSIKLVSSTSDIAGVDDRSSAFRHAFGDHAQILLEQNDGRGGVCHIGCTIDGDADIGSVGTGASPIPFKNVAQKTRLFGPSVNTSMMRSFRRR